MAMPFEAQHLFAGRRIPDSGSVVFGTCDYKRSSPRITCGRDILGMSFKAE